MAVAAINCFGLSACTYVLPGDLKVLGILASNNLPEKLQTENRFGPFFRIHLDISSLEHPSHGSGPIYEASYCGGKKKYFLSSDRPSFGFLSPVKSNVDHLYVWITSKSLNSNNDILLDRQDVCIYLDYGAYSHPVSPMIQVPYVEFDTALKRLRQIN